MQSIRGALLLLTVCLCASGIRAKPSFDIFKDIWADLADGGKSIIEGLRTATQDGAVVGKDLVINRLNSKKEFFNDISSLGENLSNALSASLSHGLRSLSETLTESINTFTEKVASERNLVKKRAQANGLAALNELHSVALKLESDLSDINQRLAVRLSIQLNETYNEVLQWRNEQLARVDSETEGAGLKEAELRASQFFSYFIEDVQSVVEELEIKKSLFEQELNDKVSTYSAYVDDLIKAMNSCSLLASLQCQRRIDEAVENLRGGREELGALLEAGKNMISRGVQDSETIASVLEKVRLNKLDFERGLDEIIERYRETIPAPYPPREDEGSDVDSGHSLDDGSADDESEDASDEVLFKLSESSRRLAAQLFNSTRDGIDFSKDILENLYDSQTQFVNDVTQLAKDLSVAASEVIISSLGQLADVLSSNILELEEKVNEYQGPGGVSALNTGLTVLRKLNSTVSDLRLSLPEISTYLADELSDKVNATLNELLEWKDVQLQRVENSANGTGVEEAAGVIGRLLQSSTDDFLEALRQLEQAKSEFEEQLLQVSLSVLKRYANLLSFAMRAVLSNSKSAQHKSDILTYSWQVQRGAAALQSLLQKSQEVAKASELASKRVAQLLQRLAREKLDTEGELARIIERNAQQGDESSSAESDDGAPSQESGKGAGEADEGSSPFPGKFRRSKRETDGQNGTASSVISSNLTASLTESNGFLDGNITELAVKIESVSDNDSARKSALTSGLEALKILQSAAANLSTLLAEINTQLADSPSEKVSEALTGLSAWETEQLTRLSEGSNARGVRQGKDTIKLVAERNERILESTKNNFELQASQFEKEVKDKISANTRNARTMIDLMTKCSEGSMSSGRCSTKINQLAVSLNNSPNDLKAVQKKSTSLLKAGENATANVDSYIEKMKADQEKCEKDIDTIIANNPNPDSTADASSTEVTSSQEADDETTSSDSEASNDGGEST